MSSSALHPWAQTADAIKAAESAVQRAISLTGAKALAVGRDELFSVALDVLVECARPPRERLRVMCAQCGGSLEGVRAGAKFCSPKCRDLHKKHVARGKAGAETLPPVAQGHIGSMWKWPEESRFRYAVQEIGYRVANFVLSQKIGVELTDVSGEGSPSAYEDMMDAEYARALEAYETTGEIPWHLLSDAQAAELRARMLVRAA